MRALGSLLRAATLAVAALALAAWIVTPLGVAAQLALGGAVVALALATRKLPGRVVTEMLVVASIATSARYLAWRLGTTLHFARTVDLALGVVLVAAELYAFVVLVLGHLQTVHALRRAPVPLPDDPSRWPTIDVFVPTYHEPVDVVGPTLLAAKALDWPREKLRVYLLDDGRRAEMRELAAHTGAIYVAREDNEHAKAGNLNHALARTRGELVAVFDCDHVVARSFLQLTVGWFLRDPKLAIVQTPHHFYNADPIDRNLGTFRRAPAEGELFYGLIQAGNDFWNASFFCGSCALLRRAALEEIGGVATESVTEDALTSLRLQRRGWNAAYLGVRQAAGLATETLAAHVGQRVRWARGMAQILRVDNPLLGPGLSIGQRLCYLNAVLHYFYGLPRLVFLTAPLAYLLLGARLCDTNAPTLLAYVLPHLALSMVAGSRVRGKFRRSFRDGVHETLLASWISWPTTLALVAPKAATFKVTAKGNLVAGDGLDRRMARPYLVLLVLDALGIGFAIARLLLWDFYDAGTVLLNLAWTAASAVIVAAALAVAWEKRQVRRAHRVPVRLRAMLVDPRGHTVAGETTDASLGGCCVERRGALPLEIGEACTVVLFEGDREHPARARVVATDGDRVRLRFVDVDVETQAGLVQAILGRPDAWLDWNAPHEPDRPLGELRAIGKDALGAAVRTSRSASGGFWAAGGATAAAAAVFLLAHTGWRVEPVVVRLGALAQMVTGKLGVAGGAEGRP